MGRLGTSIMLGSPIAERDGWTCVLEGEYAHVNQDRFETTPVPLLDGWHKTGTGFAHAIQGSFVAAIHDPRQNTLTLCNDRFGQRPLYYHHDGNRLVFAPTTRMLRILANVAPTLDLDAVAQFFRYQQILDNRSMFREFTLLPPASILVFDGGSGALKLSSYWDVNALELERRIGWNETVQRGAELVRRSVRRCFHGQQRIGLYLSGGIDSRMIIGALGKEAQGIHAANYGHPAGGDCIYAQRVARAAGVQLQRFDPVRPGWIVPFLQFYFHASYTPLHYFNAGNNTIAQDVRSWLDINVSGVMGDAVIGDLHDSTALLRTQDRAGMVDAVDDFWGRGHFYPGAIDIDQSVRLFTPDFATELNDRARAALESALDRYVSPWNRRQDFLYLHTRARRGLGNLLFVERACIENRTPFYDYELVDFFYSVPYDFRIDRRLQIGVLNALSPRLSRIPLSGHNIPPILDPRWIKLHQIGLTVRRHAQGLLPVLPRIPTNQVSSWTEWTAAGLSAWIEDLLFSSGSHLAPFLQADYARSLVRRLLAGDAAAAWTVAGLISFELARRQS
jgi:asparagine synthase (glutamine-hydrolysing)